MATTGELLVQMSTLDTGTAMDHFTHISFGGGCDYPTITYIDIVDTSAVGASDGEIIITATGTGLPFEYSIGFGFQTGNTFTSLSAATYTIEVRNVSGFTSSLGGVKVSNPSGGGSCDYPTITYIDIVDTSTVGASDGEITVTATGTGLPFEYSIGFGFQTGNTFTSLSASTYTIEVKNVSGFTASLGGIQVSNPYGGADLPYITGVTTTDTSSRVEADGSITIYATGGLEPYQYKLNDGIYGSSNHFTGLPSNIYTLYVKDAAGEETSLSGIRINQPPVVTGSIGRKVDRERYLKIPRPIVRGIKLTDADTPITESKIYVNVQILNNDE